MDKCKFNSYGDFIPCEILKVVSPMVFLTYDKKEDCTKLTFVDKSAVFVKECRYCGVNYMELFGK